jgi:hypothetical protein
MQAVDRPFAKIINGASQFIVPVFQRDYSWSEGNCRQLWKDIITVAGDRSDGKHFIGSVVYIATGDTAAGFTRWLLIDGQQRVTTLTLLLIALRDYIQETGWSGSEDGPTVKRIEAYFLKNVQEEGTRESKLVLRRRDNDTLRALLAGEDMPDDASPLVRENYDFFIDRLREEDPEKVYRGINKLIVIDVTLERGIDDPQLIFESLNSTGVDLSQSDLIRNFILMGQKESEQTRLYETYWAKIEASFRGSERTFDSFVRDYLALLTKPKKLLRSDQVYFSFRERFRRVHENAEDLEALLADLRRMAKYYAAFAVASEDDAIGRRLSHLRRLVDVPAIVVMRLFDCYDRLASLSQEDFCEAIDLLESYLLRRAVIGLQSRGYGFEFTKLAYAVSDDEPLVYLQAAMARLSESYAFPLDEDFTLALKDSDLYHKRVCFHLLDGLENRGSKEPSPTEKYTIEHVLPQTPKLSADWREMLGTNWQSEQKTWVHRLGNLTLTAYNSSYSDRPFAQKKTIKGGFAESSVRLNKDIRDMDLWDADTIGRRGVLLAARAVEIWPSLDVAPSVIERMELEEKKEIADNRDISEVPMSQVARSLFEELSKRLHAAFPGTVELPGSRSVSYHDPKFYLEVIPRKNSLGLVIDLDFTESATISGIMQDTANWTFIMYSEYSGGTYCNIEDVSQLEDVMPAVELAHSMGSST